MPENQTPAPQATPASTTNNQVVTPTNTPAPKPLSFQQLETEQDGAVDLDELTQVKPAKGKAQQDTDVLNEPDEDDDLDDDGDDEDEGVEAEGEEDSEDEAKGDEDGDEDTESDQEEKPDDVLGDEDLEKKLRVKINGKWEERSLKDWRNVIASGAHNLKTFKAWEHQKQADLKVIDETRAQLGVANAKITPAWEKLKKKDVEGTIYELAQAAGFNKLEVTRRLREQMLGTVAQRLGLTEQEVRQRLTQMEPHNRALDIQEENEYLKTESQRLAEASKPKQPDALALEQRKIQDMMVEHGISKSELKWAYEWMHEKAPQGMKPNITVESLQNTIVNKRFVEKAFDAIEAKRPSLAEDQRFVDRTVRKLKNNPDWTVARLARWVDKQARTVANDQKKQQVNELTRDVSRKALKTKGKDGFANPNVSRNKAMRFNDLVDDDQSSDLI